MRLGGLLNIFFPPLCHSCRQPVPPSSDIHLCPQCRELVKAVSTPLCITCGTPFQTIDGIDHRCGGCLASPPPFAAARAAVAFDGPVRELVHRFKYSKQVRLRRPLGLMMAERLAPFATEASPDLLIPVPLHIKRLRGRGFNQALLLASLLGRQWGIQVSRHNLRRVRWTEPQVELSPDERIKNVRGAFQVADPGEIAGKRIMLVDDVYTTGSTVKECAKTLKQAGAAAVYVATVAIAL